MVCNLCAHIAVMSVAAAVAWTSLNLGFGPGYKVDRSDCPLPGLTTCSKQRQYVVRAVTNQLARYELFSAPFRCLLRVVVKRVNTQVDVLWSFMEGKWLFVWSFFFVCIL